MSDHVPMRDLSSIFFYSRSGTQTQRESSLSFLSFFLSLPMGFLHAICSFGSKAAIHTIVYHHFIHRLPPSPLLLFLSFHSIFPLFRWRRRLLLIPPLKNFFTLQRERDSFPPPQTQYGFERWDGSIESWRGTKFSLDIPPVVTFEKVEFILKQEELRVASRRCYFFNCVLFLLSFLLLFNASCTNICVCTAAECTEKTRS